MIRFQQTQSSTMSLVSPQLGQKHLYSPLRHNVSSLKPKRIHVGGLVKASMNNNKDVHVLSKEHLAVSLAKYVADLSEKYIREKGRFTVVLSPGPVKYLRKLVEPPYCNTIDWSKWHIFLVDERVVPDPDQLATLPLLQRAHSLFSLAKLTSTLFELKLKCRGINPNDHAFKSELNRLSVCQKRLERLPDLSEEQWQDMVEQKFYEEQTGQKRKYPSSEEQFDQIDSKEYVEKLPGEDVVGGSSSGSSIKEAIIIDLSDDDDDDDDEYM